MGAEFTFDADGVRSDELARAIGEFYGASVLIYGDQAAKPVHGRLVATNIVQAVDALGFLTGSIWRKTGERVYYVGGAAPQANVRSLRSFPSYGAPGVLNLLSRDGSSAIVGDRIIVEADPARLTQITDVMESLRERPSCRVEIFVLDSSSDDAKRINQWLGLARVGAGVVAQSALTFGSGGYQIIRGAGPVYDVQLQGVLDLIREGGSTRIESHEQVQVVSGGKTTFESGQVLQDVTYTTVGQTAGQLQSGISFRTVGLTLTIGATQAATNWFLTVDMKDSQLSGSTENTTHYTGERFAQPGQGFFLLGSFRRRGRDSVREGWPVLPWVHRSVTTSTEREVTVLARLVDGLDEHAVVPSAGGVPGWDVEVLR